MKKHKKYGVEINFRDVMAVYDRDGKEIKPMSKRKTVTVKEILWIDFKKSDVQRGEAVFDINTKKHKFCLHLTREEVSYLAGYIWSFLKEDERQNEIAQDAMRGKP